MKKLLLIRRNRHDNIVWKQILAQLPCTLYDICEPSQINIRVISTQREVQLDFRGLPLERFDRIIFIGSPHAGVTDDDSHFAWSERDAALIAALRISGALVFNPALSLAYNKILQNQLPFCKQWEKPGWKVPAVEYTVDAGGLRKKLDPDPAVHTSYLLFITAVDYFLWPGYNITFLQQDKFLRLLTSTQKELWTTGHDLLILRLFVDNGEFYIFGYVPELPNLKDNTMLVKLIADII